MHYSDMQNGVQGEIDPNMYRLIALRRMLALEVKTGMSHSRGSVMKQVKMYTYLDESGKEVYITNKNTKKGVLADLEEFLTKFNI